MQWPTNPIDVNPMISAPTGRKSGNTWILDAFVTRLLHAKKSSPQKTKPLTTPSVQSTSAKSHAPAAKPRASSPLRPRDFLHFYSFFFLIKIRILINFSNQLVEFYEFLRIFMDFRVPTDLA